MRTEEDTVNEFMIEVVYPEYLEHLASFKQNVHEDRNIYISLIAQALESFCQHIISVQKNHSKEEIKYIAISCLYTSFFQGHNEFVVTGHNHEGYKDERPLTYYFDVSTYLSPLIDLKQRLLKKCMPYINYRDVLKTEIEKLILQTFPYYVEGFIQLVRLCVDSFIDTESFKRIEKHGDFQLVVGEYMDRAVLVYSTQNTYSSSDKCSYRIRCQKNHLINGFYQKEFITENISYHAYDFRYSVFPDAYFSSCELTKCILSNTTFNGSHFEEVDFSESIGHDSMFNKCRFKNVICQRFYADSRLVEGLGVPTGFIGFQCKESVLEQVDFSQSILFGADFRKTVFIDCNFSNCDLSMADFRGAQFENTSFDMARLKDARMDNRGRDLNLTRSQLDELKGR